MSVSGIDSLVERLDRGTTDFLLDGVARTPGANNTHWNTDVRPFNPNDTPLDVNIDSAGFSSGNSTVTRSIPPSGLIEIVDILGAGGFGYPDGVAGALRCNNGLGHVSQCIGDGVVLSGVTCRSCGVIGCALCIVDMMPLIPGSRPIKGEPRPPRPPIPINRFII